VTKKKAAGEIDPALDKAVTKLLKSVTLEAKDDHGKPLYTLTDVMKVIAAKTKLEAIRMSKGTPGGYGSAFDDPPEDEDDEE
jgi:hypothetical protein